MCVEFPEYCIFLTHGGMQPRATLLEEQHGKTMRQITGARLLEALRKFRKVLVGSAHSSA